MGAGAANKERHPAKLGNYLAQLVLGFLCKVCFCLPYVRRVRGLRELPRKHHLFVCNHISLLDTILLGGVFWFSGRLPILVLGDRAVWQQGFIRRLLSSKVGYLIDRERISRDVIRQLRVFGRSHTAFNLIVFPEGTRGDGTTVGEAQPGIYVIAREARLPIVPIFIAHMQEVSTKTTPFRALHGLRKVEATFGEAWNPEEYAGLSSEEFLSETRRRIQALAPA